MQRQSSGKDLGVLEEYSLSGMDCLGHRMCEEVVNQLLDILAMGRFSLKLDFWD